MFNSISRRNYCSNIATLCSQFFSLFWKGWILNVRHLNDCVVKLKYLRCLNVDVKNLLKVINGRSAGRISYAPVSTVTRILMT